MRPGQATTFGRRLPSSGRPDGTTPSGTQFPDACVVCAVVPLRTQGEGGSGGACEVPVGRAASP